MKEMTRILLAVYKGTLSFVFKVLFGGGCRFQPTCSEYASQAIEKFGVGEGTGLALRRLSRCHPWGPMGFDPVPQKI